MWMEGKVRNVDIAAETGRSTAAALLTRNDLRITGVVIKNREKYERLLRQTGSIGIWQAAKA